MTFASWARERGIPVCEPAEFAAGRDLRENPSMDYGGLVRRVPACVIRPREIDELAACVAELGRRELRWVTRGAGHSSGGQPLVEGGVVVDTRHLDRVVADGGETVTIQAGAWWLELFRRLAPSGRRPAVLTDNLRSSIGGTLSVGGVGDTSHVEGLQIDSVVALTLVTPDGAIQRVGPGDELFAFALGGEGRLGVIAEVTLSIRRRPPALAARTLAFASLVELVDAIAAARCDFVRARIFWRAASNDNPVKAVFGQFSSELAAAPPASLGRKASAPHVIDLVARAAEGEQRWPAYAPCAELAFPLPDGLAAWAALNQEVRAAGLPATIDGGSSVVVVAPGARLPFGLVPDGAPGALVVALRPGLPDEASGREVASWLRGLSERAVAAGARVYPIGEAPPRRWPPAAERLRAAVDPRGLCHP